MNSRILLISIITIAFTLNLASQTSQKSGYNIKVSVPEKEGSMAYLVSYWKGQTFISDSTMVPSSGVFTFSNSNNTLSSGQYLLYIKPDVQVEFLIDESEQDINMSLDLQNFKNSKIEGTKNSTLLWQYIEQLNLYQKELDSYIKVIHDKDVTKLARDKAINDYKTQSAKINSFTNESIKNSKGTWFSVFTKAMSPIRGPHILAETNEEVKENRDYVKKHYFDNLDFVDERLWRTSFFLQHIDSYLENWIFQDSDTIALESSKIVEKTKENKTIFEFMLSHLTNKALESKVMGMENVWAKLAEDYIFDKNISWIDSSQYDALKRDYSLIELNRIGMKAQDLKFYTIDGDSINTNNIQSDYLLLYFYSPSCSHCRTELPLLRKDIYDVYKDKNLKIVAINTDNNSVGSWSSFIEGNKMEEYINVFDPNFKSQYWMKYDASATPSVYLLDKNKTIVAKKIDVSGLKKVFKYMIPEVNNGIN